jgi:hypothetical protein
MPEIHKGRATYFRVFLFTRCCVDFVCDFFDVLFFKRHPSEGGDPGKFQRVVISHGSPPSRG